MIAIYDANGEKQVEYAYDAWGNCEVVYAGNPEFAKSNPIRYRGYYYDIETKLYYLNARYYSPEWRRFISPDAAEYIDPETPNGLNLYAYCGNDPINRIDPLGCDWWNPFTWDWQGAFNSIGTAFSEAGQWLNSNVLSPVGDFFVNNWDIVLGVGLIATSAVIGVMTFGASTLISGVIAGAVFGAAFGTLNAAISGGNILQSAATGLLVGGLGGISGWAAAAFAAGISLIHDGNNGKEAVGDSILKAGISALTAGVFAGIGNGVVGMVNKEIVEMSVKSVSGVLFGFIFSSHNFISDAIINRLSLT